MVKVSGAAAYQGLQKIDNGTSQVLQNLTGIAAQENAAEKLAEERSGVREQERKAAEYKAEQDYLEKNKIDLTRQISNHKNVEDALKTYVTGVLPEHTELINKANDARKRGDITTQREYEQQAKNLQSSFETLKTIVPLAKDMIKNYVENSDKYLPSDPRLKLYEGLMKNNFTFTYKNGKVKAIVGIDKDNDGTISEEEREAGDKYLRDGFKTEGFEFTEISVEDFVQGGYEGFNKIPILEKDGLIDNISKSVIPLTIDQAGFDYITTKTELTPENILQLRKNIQGELRSKEVLANVLTRMGKVNESGFVDNDNLEFDKRKDKQEIEDYLLNAVKGKYDLKIEKKVSSETNSMRRAGSLSGGGKGDAVIVDATDKTGVPVKSISIGKPFELQGQTVDMFGKPTVSTFEYNTVLLRKDGKILLSSGDPEVEDKEVNKNQLSYVLSKIGKTEKEIKEIIKTIPDDTTPIKEQGVISGEELDLTPPSTKK